MIENKSMVIRSERNSSSPTLMKSSLSKTLVYQTNKEFDHCAELLTNILSVQESRRNRKSSAVNRTTKDKPSGQTLINSRTTKTTKSKGNISKSSLIKTNINNGCAFSQGGTETNVERRSTLVEDKSKKFFNRQKTPTRHFHRSRFSSPKTKIRDKSPSVTNRYEQQQRRHDDAKRLTRSSSCLDLSTKKKKSFSFSKRKQNVFEQFGKYLKQIQILSKQIRSKTFHSDSECSRLWNEFDSCLSSALLFLNSNELNSFSFDLLQKQFIDLKQELRKTNVHLKEFDLIRRHSERNVHQSKEQFKMKCEDLQTKLEELQQTNLRLIQRLTERDLRSLIDQQRWITTNNRSILRKEIVSLREKLYNLYDDLTTMINQNRSLRFSIEQQRQEIQSYRKLFEKSKQSAEKLVRHIDHRSMENKMKEFLNEFLRKQYPEEIFIDRQSNLFDLKEKFQRKSSSSTTIADADPTLSSRSNSSTIVLIGEETHRNSSKNFSFFNVRQSNGENLCSNESEAEFDQISDLTSKIFSSAHDDEDDGVFLDHDLSSSSLSSSFNEIHRFVTN